ncbi:F-box/kelch-repeat protein At3g06240-like [Bidens hawaiensis]|uniref:F-box/kelch-repeat protein At3g06240-like n=1 Tax=Bidens hawaiensis TaxID=980011 RepID=UPI00404940D2
MADILPDDVLRNIFARLPAKPLVRLWCVSKYWYGMLREPNFMKLRSRKTILLTLPYSFHLIDDNVPTDNTSYSVVEGCYPSGFLKTVIGTLNGIVVLRTDANVFRLYNPLTGVTKLLPYAPGYHAACGFGYGATPYDLKIIRFKRCSPDIDVYNFKENSWRRRSCNISKLDLRFMQHHDVGHFINGSLYWPGHRYHNVLIAINVKDLVASKICLPFKVING